MEDVVETAKNRLHRERRQDQPHDAAYDIGIGRAEKPLHEISADKAAIGEAQHDDQKRCRLDLLLDGIHVVVGEQHYRHD